MSRVGFMRKESRHAAIALVLLLPALPGSPAVSAQVAFDQAMRDLASSDTGTRLRTVQMLKDAAFAEAAVPLAALVTDPDDRVQLEAIAAELNIFLAEKIVTRKRVGLVIEKRNAIVAESAFSSGRLAIGSRAVPVEVVTALRTAARDENPRVAAESLYALGALATEVDGRSRGDLLHAVGPELAAYTGAADPTVRYAAIRVIGRVFARRPHDDAIDESLGDAVITALNDSDRGMKTAAMQTLGAIGYGRGVQALTELFQYYARHDLGAAALDALARIAYQSSEPLFVEQLAGRNAPMRGIAIEGLARLGNRARAAEIDTVARGDRNDGVTLAAAFGAVMLADAPIDAIASALMKAKLRDQALGYVAELAWRRPSALSPCLRDPDARIRTDAVDALGLAGDPAAVSMVEPLLKDNDPQVSRAAERAMARLRAAAGRPVS